MSGFWHLLQLRNQNSSLQVLVSCHIDFIDWGQGKKNKILLVHSTQMKKIHMMTYSLWIQTKLLKDITWYLVITWIPARTSWGDMWSEDIRYSVSHETHSWIKVGYNGLYQAARVRALFILSYRQSLRGLFSSVGHRFKPVWSDLLQHIL